MISQLEQSVAGDIELRQQVVVELIASLFQLHLGQVSEVVVGLSDEFLRGQERIDQESPAGHLSRDPLGAAIGATARVEFLRGHVLLLQAANPGPVVDL